MKYQSKYSPGKEITPHQFIVELICEKRAKTLDKQLPIYFWKLQEWRTYFVYQSKICGQLLQEFAPEAVIRALKDKSAYKTYSLSAPYFKKIVQKHQSIIDKEKSNSRAETLDYTDNATFKTNTGKKTKLDKLKELE